MSHLQVHSSKYTHDREHAVMQDMSVADSDAIELEPIVQRVCGVTHANGEISGDAQLGQSLELTIDPETDALFYDASDSFEFEDDNVLQTAVYDMYAVELAIAKIERLCSLETQQWEIDCSGAASSVLQSVPDMPLPDDADMVMHGQVVPEDAYGTEVH